MQPKTSGVYPRSLNVDHMIRLLTLVFIAFNWFLLFAQQEEVGPLTFNYDLQGKRSMHTEKGLTGSFDSTFIYIVDTLQLPFFDEFSKNHFQQYSVNYSDPTVSSDKKYRILDNNTLVPISNEPRYTGQVTFRRVFDVVASNYVDEIFTPVQFKVGDLTSYPVNYATTNLYPPYYIYDTVGAPDVSDTVWITDPEYFQDSATQFFMTITDPDAYWLEEKAYHNFRFALEPRSLGVVTFDGLDENGYPYSIGTSITNWADVLTSKPIDLSPYDASDSVYFSFLYQAEGFGDVPEPTDSLVLEFYSKDLDQWKRVWSDSGQVTSEFKVGHLRLKDAQYFKKGFQFRFRNYGALSGSLDHFHLDYVHLRTLSGYQDTLFKDFAFSYPIGSLIKKYTSVPWDHFKNNPSGKMNDQAKFTVHNGSNLSENNQNGSVQISYGGSNESSFTLNAQTLSGGNINYGPRTTYTSLHDLSGGYIYDVSKTGPQQSFDLLATASAQFPNLAQNDSTAGVQFFSNYYSYDDGTAEAAYGPTSTQARLAIRYEAYEPDSIIGLRIHFVPSVNDVSDNLFLITIWDDNAGQPGSVLYEDDVFFPRSPEYSLERNGFIDYFLLDTMKVPVGTIFYVGWRQLDPERLNVGLDRNLDNSENTFYSIDNGISWNQSSISGSVMIRPVFSTELDAQLGLKFNNEKKNLVNVFPNPSEGIVTIDIPTENFFGATLFSLSGTKLMIVSEPTFSIAGLASGMYLLQINGIDQMVRIFRP
jgi:hypothetical protein